MRYSISGMVLWLFAASIAMGDSDAAKTIQTILDEKTAAFSTAYADAVTKQVEAAKQAESRLKALVTEQANKPGESEAIKARNDAIKERERLEALEKTPKALSANVGDLQRSLDDAKARIEDLKKNEVKLRDDAASLKTQLAKTETRGRELQTEVDRLSSQSKKKPVPPEFANRLQHVGKRWNWVDLLDCKHDTKTWYEAKAFLKPGADHSWLHYGMTEETPSPDYKAHYEVIGLSPYSDNLVEVKVTFDKDKAWGLMLWNTVTNVIFPLSDVPYCAALDPKFHMLGPAEPQKKK